MNKKEKFTKLSKKEFIKIWRTMKAETGNRQTCFMSGVDEVSIKQLMERYEARTFLLRKKKFWRKK